MVILGLSLIRLHFFGRNCHGVLRTLVCPKWHFLLLLFLRIWCNWTTVVFKLQKFTHLPFHIEMQNLSCHPKGPLSLEYSMLIILLIPLALDKNLNCISLFPFPYSLSCFSLPKAQLIFVSNSSLDNYQCSCFITFLQLIPDIVTSKGVFFFLCWYIRKIVWASSQRKRYKLFAY